jgi:hypothetical protein
LSGHTSLRRGVLPSHRRPLVPGCFSAKCSRTKYFAVATRWRFLKSKKPPRRAAFRINTDKSVSCLGCGDRI